jgi:lysophospholipase L1-like esterase
MLDRPKLYSRLLLVVLSVSFTLLIAETIFRFAFPELHDTAYLEAAQEVTSVSGFTQLSADPILYYELRPGTEMPYAGGTLSIHENGYRYSGKAPQAEPADIKIALLGDSTSFGWRVPFEASYPEIFRAALAEHSGKTIELRNYSVPGYNTEQELHLLRTQVDDFNPDLLIIHYDHNDSIPTWLYRQVSQVPPSYGDNLLRSALIKALLRQVKEAQLQNAARRLESENETVSNYLAAGPVYDAHINNIEALVAEIKDQELPALFIIFTPNALADPSIMTSNGYQQLQQSLIDRLEALDQQVLNLYPHQQQKVVEMGWEDLKDWWIATDPADAHPNVAGHEFIAAVLFDYVLEQPQLLTLVSGPAP